MGAFGLPTGQDPMMSYGQANPIAPTTQGTFQTGSMPSYEQPGVEQSSRSWMEHAQMLERSMEGLWAQLNELRGVEHMDKVHSPNPALRPAKPVKFKGTKEDADHVEGWLFSLEKTFEYYPGSMETDKARIAYAITMLDSHALLWWRYMEKEAVMGRSNLPSTWVDFCGALIKRFMPINAERTARDKLLVLKQTGSVSAYAMEMQRLLLLVPDKSPADQLHAFITGLKPALQKELLTKDPKDLHEAIDMADRIDLLTYRSMGRWTPKTTVNTPRITQGPTPMELGAMQEMRSRKGNGGHSQAKDEALCARLEEELCALKARIQSKPKYTQPKREVPYKPNLSSNVQAKAGTNNNSWQLDKLKAMGLCYRCHQPGHRFFECPQNPANMVNRPKGGAPPA